MSLLTRNVCRALMQGTYMTHMGKGVHTTSVNADKNVCYAPHSISTLQSSSTEGRIKCTLIPGDGVGPELVYSVQEVFKAADIPVDFESFFFSEVNPTLSAPLEDVVNSIARNKCCIKGILATPDFSHTGELQTLNMKLRNALDLYANVVHVKSLPNVKSRHHDVDCIIIREQTEGEYSALEHESVPGVVECLKIITAAKSERIAKFAFDYAVKMGRKKVTAVHKANIMKLGDGLFLRSCEEMAKLYPRLQFEKMIVDNCSMQMVSNPNQFDVMVTPNLYGNIVDNLASGLVGGAGVVAGASYSAECAVFEQGARHIFSGAVGKNIANPTAMLLCSANLLAHVNLHPYSRMIKNAINKCPWVALTAYHQYKYRATLVKLHSCHIFVSLQSSLDIKCSSTMAALKTTLVLLLIAFAMLASVGAVRVGPCDQVCSRIDAEKDECCRAHGYSGYNSCRGGRMDCY